MSGRALALVSGKGGVGKSVLAAALGAAWARQGRKVALVDVNTGLRALDMLLGLENRVVYDLGDVLEGLCEIETAMIPCPGMSLWLLAARQITDTEALDEEALSRLVGMLSGRFDVVLLDAPTGMGQGFVAAAYAAEETLLVVTPDDLSLRDGERMAGLLERLGAPRPHVVINRIRADFVREGLQYPPDVCAQVLDMRPIGVIPEDDALARAALGKTQPPADSPAAQAIEAIRCALDGEEVAEPLWQEQNIIEETAEPAPVIEKKRGLGRLFGRERGRPQAD
ncbi:MAG: P-loop NTPase [Oscillospiraceae bacterium]|jgi:septum site-determining protein MinD|nr:P-loop NTPase [Oscillospiraceae bacterium]